VSHDRVLRMTNGSTIESDRWDTFVAAHPDGRQAQSTRWAMLQELRGWEARRIAATRGEDLVGLSQVLIRRLPGGRRIGYVARSPLVTAGDTEAARGMTAGLSGLQRDIGLDALVVDPPDPHTAAALTAAGFRRTRFDVTLAATVVVDLGGTEDEILARMKSKTRYNIRKAMRSGIEVRIGDAGDVEIFHEMLAETGRRQGFSVDSRRYIEGALSILDEGDGAALLIAEHRGDPLAGILVTAFGDRVSYKRGGWSGSGGSLHPNEALHWTAMRWARSTGRRWYDFDGIDPAVAAEIGESAASADARRSVAHFKLGFGGEVLPLPPTLVRFRNPAVQFTHDNVPPRALRLIKRVVRRVQVSS